MTDELSQIDVVTLLVRSHDKPHPQTGHREPILVIRSLGGSSLHHHAFGDGAGGRPDLDDAYLEELAGLGLIDFDYSGNTPKFAPTAFARKLVEQHERVMTAEPVADVSPVLLAISQQYAAGNKLGWPAVRPVLAALREYWEAGGFSSFGIQVPAIRHAVSDEYAGLFAATLRALVAGGYLEATSALTFNDMPAEVELTDRAHSVLDGWPGATPEDLLENFLAVLAAQAAAESDPEKESLLRRVGETVRELGVQTGSEVLAKVITGG